MLTLSWIRPHALRCYAYRPDDRIYLRGIAKTIAVLAVGLVSHAAPAAPTSAMQTAVYSNGPVTLESYSAVQGDIYSGANATLEFGYEIQRPGLTLGDVYAAGDFFLGSLSNVIGNVFTNGSVTVDGSGKVHGSITAAPGTVYPCLPMPQPASFNHGTSNLTLSGGVLSPGAYGDITIKGGTLTFTAGNYYLRSLTTTTTTTFNFDLTSGPINLFVTDDINLVAYQKYQVNGDIVDQYLTQAQRDLASQVLIEAHGNITNYSRSLSGFFGTMLAPFGQITLDSADSFGALIACDGVTAETYLRYFPSDELLSRPLVDDHCPPPGDTDGDGDVDDSDLGNAFANYTGPVGAAGGRNFAFGDSDGDGDVDDSDLGTAFSNYTGPTATTNVPEPAGLAALSLLGLLGVCRRR